MNGGADTGGKGHPADAVGAAEIVDILFADARDALLLVAGDDSIARVNGEWTVLCGGDPEAMIGRRFASILSATTPCEIADLMRQARSEGREVGMRIAHRHPNGFDLVLEALIAPVRTAGAEGDGYLVRLRPSRRDNI